MLNVVATSLAMCYWFANLVTITTGMQSKMRLYIVFNLKPGRTTFWRRSQLVLVVQVTKFVNLGLAYNINDNFTFKSDTTVYTFILGLISNRERYSFSLEVSNYSAVLYISDQKNLK